MKKIISTLLIILGVGLLLYPLGGKLYNNYRQQQVLKAFEQDLKLSFEETSDDLASLSLNSDVQQPDKEFTVNDIDTNTNQKINLGNVIGIISVPKIEITLPIMEGTSEKQLSQAIGHLPATPLPGQEGNAGLAGHRGHTFSTFFNRLNEMEKEDEVFIRTKDSMLTYKVYETKIIDPTDFSVLNPVKDESTITLITCHPLYSDKQRLIVHAKLVEKSEINSQE